VAQLAVIPLQDVLELGSEARMNTPGTTEGNWAWRYAEGEWTEAQTAQLREAVQRYGRLPGEGGVVGDN